MKPLVRRTITAIIAMLSVFLLALPTLAFQSNETVMYSPEQQHVAQATGAGFYDPNKVWIRKGPGGVWEMVTDPEHTNNIGADNNAFLDGEEVAAAVNMSIPPFSPDNLERLEIEDDWTQVDRYLDPQDVATVRIYEFDTGGYQSPSINGINVDGKDVTDQFNITIEGTLTKASAKSEYIRELKRRHTSMQISMLVPFIVRFDRIADLEQDGLNGEKTNGVDNHNTCRDGQQELRNKGGAVFGEDEYMETNDPLLCIIRPTFEKDVTASETEGGDGSSIDGRSVLPGQTVTYELNLNVGWMREDMLEKLEFTDTYDQRTIPDKTSLTITRTEDSGRNVIPFNAYETDWDDGAHRFTIRFHKEWLTLNWQTWRTHDFTVEFDAKVSDDIAPDTVIANKGWVTLNNTGLESNEVSNRPVDPEPVKQDTQSDPGVDIDGKTALLGDRIYYRVTIDAENLTDQAYLIRRLGVIDDYDEEHLSLDESGIQVLDAEGNDVTDKLNIQVSEGVVYAFFKTVDTTLADGTVIQGDPQPNDLAEYAQQDSISTTGPGLDQNLLGKSYQLVLPMTVIKVTDAYQVENTATQVTNHRRAVSNTVVNTLTEINPYKDVTVEVGAESADGMSIYKHQTFLYQLNSSTLPANRAYPEVTSWRIDDDYDESGDEYTGQWAVYASEDLHVTDGSILAAKGSRIAGSGFDATALGGDLFTMNMRDGAFTIAATQRYLDLVSADNAHEQGWRAYVQFRRIKAGKFSNTFVETINDRERPSNEVTTNTPQSSPSISLEKFDEHSGLPTGDRDESKDALEIAGDGTRIVFRITNTGDVSLTALRLTDKTIIGDGEVTDIEYPENWGTLVLKPGESVDVIGTLTGVTNLHTDRAVVEGSPIVECVPKDDDPFDDKPAPPVDPNEVCTDTPVESEPDDWNAYMKRALPDTGVNIAGLMAVGVMLMAIGLGLLRLRSDANTDI